MYWNILDIKHNGSGIFVQQGQHVLPPGELPDLDPRQVPGSQVRPGLQQNLGSLTVLSADTEEQPSPALLVPEIFQNININIITFRQCKCNYVNNRELRNSIKLWWVEWENCRDSLKQKVRRICYKCYILQYTKWNTDISVRKVIPLQTKSTCVCFIDPLSPVTISQSDNELHPSCNLNPLISDFRRELQN